VQGGEQLLEVLDLQQSTLMLVVRFPGIGPAALRRLAVAEVEHFLGWLWGAAMFSQSEHAEPPSLLAAWPPRLVNM
jgi:hypothetical protein